MFKETSSSFREAYTVAKVRLSYTKLHPIMKLNEMNGAAVGVAHRSDHLCAQIAKHIERLQRNVTLMSNHLIPRLALHWTKVQFMDVLT